MIVQQERVTEDTRTEANFIERVPPPTILTRTASATASYSTQYTVYTVYTIRCVGCRYGVRVAVVYRDAWSMGVSKPSIVHNTLYLVSLATDNDEIRGLAQWVCVPCDDVCVRVINGV
jgi:hypothetical protein